MLLLTTITIFLVLKVDCTPQLAHNNISNTENPVTITQNLDFKNNGIYFDCTIIGKPHLHPIFKWYKGPNKLINKFGIQKESQGSGRIKYKNTLKYDPNFKDDNRTLKCEITGLNFGLDGFNQSEFKDFSAVVKLCKPTKFNASHSSIAMPRSDIRIRKVMDRLFN